MQYDIPNFRKISDLWHGIESRWLPDSRNVQRQAPGACVVHLFVLFAKADMDFLWFSDNEELQALYPDMRKAIGLRHLW